jgi:hypothetical protein
MRRPLVETEAPAETVEQDGFWDAVETAAQVEAEEAAPQAGRAATEATAV